jgi:hypothetical protein
MLDCLIDCIMACGGGPGTWLLSVGLRLEQYLIVTVLPVSGRLLEYLLVLHYRGYSLIAPSDRLLLAGLLYGGRPGLLDVVGVIVNLKGRFLDLLYLYVKLGRQLLQLALGVGRHQLHALSAREDAWCDTGTMGGVSVARVSVRVILTTTESIVVVTGKFGRSHLKNNYN